MSKLFGTLGADESAFDARVKAAANDAKQRWPMFKSLAPQPSELPPLLTDVEKEQRAQVPSEPAPAPRLALSRPGLSDKLSKGLSKIARQTFAEVRGSAKRPAALSSDVPPPAYAPPHSSAQRASLSYPSPPEPVSPVFSAQVAAPEKGLFGKPTAPGAAAPVSGAHRLSQFTSHQHEQPRSAAPVVEDSLAGVFQRLEGNTPKSSLHNEKPVAKVGGVMFRLGLR